jgi:hypothetical protein
VPIPDSCAAAKPKQAADGQAIRSVGSGGEKRNAVSRMMLRQLDGVDLRRGDTMIFGARVSGGPGGGMSCRNRMLSGAIAAAIMMTSLIPIQAQYQPPSIHLSPSIQPPPDIKPPPSIKPPSRVVVPEPSQAQRPLPEAVSPPRRIHKNERGRWEPDDGCDWISPNDPHDLQVRCDN